MKIALLSLLLCINSCFALPAQPQVFQKPQTGANIWSNVLQFAKQQAARPQRAWQMIRVDVAPLFKVLPHPRPHHDPSCKKTKCPPYKVLKKYRGFEERQYNKSFWAQITTIGGEEMKETKGLYKRLAEYFGGKNAKNQTMKRTAPVTIDVVRICTNGSKPIKFSFTMGFYLAVGAAAPKPTDKGIKILAYPPNKLYARIFHGHPHRLRTYWRELRILAHGVRSIKGSVYKDRFSVASYQAPFRRYQRHEVILSEKPKKEEDYNLEALFH